MPADAGAPGAPGTPARDPPVCRHWRRGGCLYGETCRFAHPPDALGASAGDVSSRAGSGAAPPARNNRRVKKKGRCGHLRRFLIDAFGFECVASGAPILDVGGGRGELAFELCNLNGANAVVVDAVPLRLARYRQKLKKGWYDKSAPLSKYNDSSRVTTKSARFERNGDDDDTEEDKSRTPTHLRALWSPTLWRVEGSNDEDTAMTRSDQRGFLLSAFGSPDPLHDSRTKGSVNVVATPEPELSAETKELHAMATYEAWAAATRVAFQTRSEKKTKKRTEPKNGDEEDEASLCGNAHGASSTVTDALLAMASVHLAKKHQSPPLSDGTIRGSVFASDPRAADVDSALPANENKICECDDTLCGESPPDASFVRGLLRNCVVVVGMHSDQATEWIVDFALEHRVRFAVVPCCVCPGLFPKRRVFSGDGDDRVSKPVRSHEQFCEYLRGKAKPGEIELKRLPFEGKNTVVFSKFDTKGGRGYRAFRAE